MSNKVINTLCIAAIIVKEDIKRIEKYNSYRSGQLIICAKQCRMNIVNDTLIVGHPNGIKIQLVFMSQQ